jgi:hypothetical protein
MWRPQGGPLQGSSLPGPIEPLSRLSVTGRPGGAGASDGDARNDPHPTPVAGAAGRHEPPHSRPTPLPRVSAARVRGIFLSCMERICGSRTMSNGGVRGIVCLHQTTTGRMPPIACG